MSRRLAREIALQVLFQLDFDSTSVNSALQAVSEERQAEGETKQYGSQIVLGVIESKKEIDQDIQKYAKEWTVDRMSGVDRNLMRLAIYEMFYREDAVPVSVAIDEAVELAKQYGTEDSPKFINGILGSMVRKKDT